MPACHAVSRHDSSSFLTEDMDVTSVQVSHTEPDRDFSKTAANGLVLRPLRELASGATAAPDDNNSLPGGRVAAAETRRRAIGPRRRRACGTPAGAPVGRGIERGRPMLSACAGQFAVPAHPQVAGKGLLSA
jgi:hypothetical protein